METKQLLLKHIDDWIPDDVTIIDFAVTSGVIETGSSRGAVTRKCTGEHELTLRWRDADGREEEKIQSPESEEASA